MLVIFHGRRSFVQHISRRAIVLRIRSQPLSELKIDMLSTSIGSCARGRRRNDFRDFAALAFRKLVIFICTTPFSRRRPHRASMPSRIPSNGLSIANHSETRHSAIDPHVSEIFRSELLVLFTVALTPLSPESGAGYFTKCEILVALSRACPTDPIQSPLAAHLPDRLTKANQGDAEKSGADRGECEELKPDHIKRAAPIDNPLREFHKVVGGRADHDLRNESRRALFGFAFG